MRFSIIIPAYNEERYVGCCLQSLLQLRYDPNEFEVILIDNGSTDKTVEIATSYSTVVVLQKRDCHVGAVRNHGAKFAKGEYLCFIDADCLVDEDWLDNCDRLIESNEQATFGGRIKLNSESTWVERAWLLGEKKEAVEDKDLLGSCTVVRKGIFEEVGGFNEEVTSGEDTQLSKDIRRKGYVVKIKPDIDVVHMGNAKTIMEFYRRQRWHGSSYLSNYAESIKDPTFLLTCLFAATLLFAVLTLLLKTYTYFLILLPILVSIPMIFSIKRLRRAPRKSISAKMIVPVYLLDFIYTAARLSGIFRELRRL